MLTFEGTDILEAQRHHKAQRELEELTLVYEKEQEEFIEKICKKYGIDSVKKLSACLALFPESRAKVRKLREFILTKGDKS